MANDGLNKETLLAVMQQTTKLLSEMNKNESKAHKKKQGEKKKHPSKNVRGSMSLSDLSEAAPKSNPSPRGGFRGRGGRRGRGYSPASVRGSRSQIQTGFHQNHDQRPPDYPPPYEAAVGTENSFNAPFPIQQLPRFYQHNLGFQTNFTQNRVYYPPHSRMSTPPIISNPPPLLPTPPLFSTLPVISKNPPLFSTPNSSNHNLKKRVPNSKDSVVDINAIMKEMIKIDDFFTTVENLAKVMDKNYDELLKVIKSSSDIFSTMKDHSTNKMMVELCPSVQLCNDHLGFNGCLKKKCVDLHICADFLVNSCTKKDCPFGHSFKTNHNNTILRTKYLSEIPPPKLIKLMQKLFLDKLFPKICYYYNQGNCPKRESCYNLHICELYVRNLGHCPTSDCSLSHDIREKKIKDLFIKLGISTNESPRDLIKILKEKCKLDKSDATLEKEESDNGSDKMASTSKKNKNSGKKADNIGKNESKDSAMKTVFSWHLNGTVDTPLICYMGVEGKCSYVKEGCKYLHSKNTYHWQFGTDKKWYNFHAYHSEILERKFKDVNCSKMSLPTLDPSKVNDSLKDLFSLLGNKGLEVNFVNMTIDCEAVQKVYKIRHLTTPSSAVCNSSNSTVFNWYFQDDQGNWTLYGNTEASSRSIEKSFQENQTGKIIFKSSNNFSYEIDFGQMKQNNLSTNKERPIRSRPNSLTPAKESLVTSTIQLPRHWETMDDNDEYKLVKLSSSTDEFKDIRQIVSLTLPMINISTIFRIQNVYVWKQYKNKEQELQKKEDINSLNIQKLFNGMDSDQLPSICRDNLEWRVHEVNHTKLHGNGAYFYTSAALAAKQSPPDFMGNRRVLVFEVILGSVALGKQGMTRPPDNLKGNCLHDTTTDDMDSPTVFVKYNKQEYYPAYVVEFC